MSDYQVIVDQTSKAEWSALLRQFSDANIYQTWSYGAVRWGEKNLSHMVLRRDSEVVAMAQAAIRKVIGFPVGIAYVPWGPIWRLKNKAITTGAFQEIIKALRVEYAHNRGLLLRVSPNEIAHDCDKAAAELTEAGFKLTSLPYRTLLLDITPPLEALRKGLDQKWRNQLNRAARNGLEVVEGVGDDIYLEFAGLYRILRARKKFETFVDMEEFRRIQQGLEADLKMRVMICYADGAPAAALVGSAIGEKGIYLLGATNDTGMKSKGSYLLQWRMIEWLKEAGCHEYDLGGIDPEGNPGVYHFKSGLSGRDVRHVGQYDLYGNLSSRLVSGLDGLIGRLRKGAIRHHLV
jgi:lipid II:glycine glycyltransferase (peptidoglycan interpeptide bridge formation enzyme)